MKIEKNLIVICMCALAIGLVTALPLTYLTPRTVAAQTTDPEFDISLDYAYFYANVVDGVYQHLIGVGFTPLIDFDAFNPQTVAKIDYFEFVYYTDDQELDRTSHFIGANNSYVDHENIHDFMTFSRASWFENNWERSCYGYWGDCTMGLGGASISLTSGPTYSGFNTCNEYDDNEPLEEIHSTILMALENKQTIYLDVIRVGYTTFDDNGDIVVAYTNGPIIQRLELTKNGDAFTFGNADVLENVIPMIERTLSHNRERGGSFPYLQKNNIG